MGCDIHTFAEVKKNGKWEKVGYIFPYRNPYRDADSRESLTMTNSPYSGGRNYGLFATLAGVRNYEGYNITPIAEPRGLPEDCSKAINKLDDDMDFHSFSWFSLEELLAIDWNKHPECKRFTVEVFPNLAGVLNELAHPEDVRIVFCFDN